MLAGFGVWGGLALGRVGLGTLVLAAWAAVVARLPQGAACHIGGAGRAVSFVRLEQSAP